MARSRAAGWYTHPEQRGMLRYWDGTDWTDDIGTALPAGGPGLSTIVLGIVLGLLIVIAAIYVVALLVTT